MSEMVNDYMNINFEIDTPYRKLKDVTEMKRGTSLVQKNAVPGNIPVISGGREPAFYCDKENRSGSVITVAGSGAGAGYVQYWNEPIFVCDAFSIVGKEGILDTKYVYYYLTNIQDKIYATKKGGGVPHVHISSIENFEIPVPSLECQSKIVEILDNFTELIEHIKDELGKREKQYAYYLSQKFNELLNDYEHLKICIGDVVQFVNGRAYKQEELLSEGKYRVLRVGNFYSNNTWYYSDLELDEDKYCKEGDILFSWAANLGPHIWKSEKTIYHYHIWKLIFDKQLIDPLFLYFFLEKDVQDMAKDLTQSTMPHISMANMKKRKLVLPPIEEQNKISRKLKLFKDYMYLLEEELHLRQLQYDYYRNKLLIFKRA